MGRGGEEGSTPPVPPLPLSESASELRVQIVKFRVNTVSGKQNDAKDKESNEKYHNL